MHTVVYIYIIKLHSYIQFCQVLSAIRADEPQLITPAAKPKPKGKSKPKAAPKIVKKANLKDEAPKPEEAWSQQDQSVASVLLYTYVVFCRAVLACGYS